jgi:hypothetical protein
VKKGHVKAWLEGEKLQGAWAFTRTGADDGGKANWLMVKVADAAADPELDPVTDQPGSVLTGRTVEEVAEGLGDQRVWHSNRS